jgi:hypothetical protein
MNGTRWQAPHTGSTLRELYRAIFTPVPVDLNLSFLADKPTSLALTGASMDARDVLRVGEVADRIRAKGGDRGGF